MESARRFNSTSMQVKPKFDMYKVELITAAVGALSKNSDEDIVEISKPIVD